MAEALVIRIKAANAAAGDLAAAPAPAEEAFEAAEMPPIAAQEEAEWLLTDTHGARIGDVHCGALSEAALLAGGRKVVVLVPGTDVLLAEPVLPLKSGVKLAQVVPFALEEQLASDVEDLHFAVGRREASATGTPVAVTSREKMDTWLVQLRLVGIHAEAIHAETSTLPVTPNGVSLLIDGSRVYVRRETAPGAVLDVDPLIEALQLALAAGEEEREHVTIYLTEGDYERDRDLYEGLREFTASLQLKLLPQGMLQVLAANAFSGAPVNLLQGPYAPKTKLNISFQPWRYAAMLAGGFLVLHMGLKVWQYIDLKSTEAQLDEGIVQAFQDAIPGAAVPDTATARRMVESRLAALRGGGPVGGIMDTLGTLGEALALTPGTRIEALSYRDNTTDLRVTAPSVDSLGKIQNVAGERGITAEIQSANPRDSKIEGRMQFKKSGA